MFILRTTLRIESSIFQATIHNDFQRILLYFLLIFKLIMKTVSIVDLSTVMNFSRKWVPEPDK
jgi:hypothetical protein